MYHYEPLGGSGDRFRLISVLPGKPEEFLRCELIHASISRFKDKYECLSYSWIDRGAESLAEQTGLSSIAISGVGELNITLNLFWYLRHLRRQETATPWIWIDALCVNQGDLKERSQQVSQMAEIFRNASRVIAWLGPASDSSRAAISFVQRNCQVNANAASSQRGKHFKWWTSDDLFRLEQDITTGHSPVAWKALQSLMGREYWRRTWVIQEAYLAKEILFYCGDDIIEYSVMWAFLENLWAYSNWAERVVPEASSLLEECNAGRTILFLRQEKDRLDLLQAVYHCRPGLSTDPKDKIYGVLGLAHDARAILPAPDYELEMTDLLFDLFESLTFARKNLDWLTLTGLSSRYPSWCPDLTRKARQVSINTSRVLSGYEEYGFRTALDSKPRISISRLTKILSVDGFIVDFVDGLGYSESQDGTGCIRQPQKLTNAYGSEEECFEAIWKTVVADQTFEPTYDSWRAPSSFREEFLKQLQEEEPIEELPSTETESVYSCLLA